MDLLMEIAPLKAKSIAYCFNNQKIRRIINIQRRKETINKTVDELKNRLIYWRKKTLNKLGSYPDSVLFPKIVDDYNANNSDSEDDNKDPIATTDTAKYDEEKKTDKTVNFENME